MPIYEYRCKACGHQLEAFQKFSDTPLETCPKCHRPDLDKLISATTFQLKGTGWYVTDVRDKDKPKPASTENAATNENKPAAENKSSDDKTVSSDSSTSAS